MKLSEDIVDKSRNLPLALLQTAGAILCLQLSFAEFLDLYQSKGFRAQMCQLEIRDQPIWTTFALRDLGSEAASLLLFM